MTAQGELIGINTAIISRSGGYQGIGFAVPSSVARQTMTQIVKQGRVIRGWLGVSIQPVNSAVAKAFGLKTPDGALVSSVATGGPAAKAGITRGDIILEFNGQRLDDTADLRMKVAMSAPDTKANLLVFRDGKERQVAVTLGELREDTSKAKPGPGEPSAVEGLQLERVTPKVARDLGLPEGTTGIAVVEVAPDSVAAEAGLRAGDVIVEVNRRPATSVDLVERALRSRTESTVLLVNRSGDTLYIVVEPR